MTNDGLILAVLEKIPNTGAAWPKAKRKVWMGLIEQAFELAFSEGGEAVAATEEPKPKADPRSAYRFYIDEDGVVRNVNGDPVSASQVDDTIYDVRGIDGDVGSIMWADGKRGLNGADVMITAG